MSQANDELLALGKKAPSFALEASTGERLSLADLRGKYAVIVFYPKNNTPG